MGFASGWHATLQPFFDQIPHPRAVGFNIDDYLHSAVNLGGRSWDTMSLPDGTDTFYGVVDA